MRAYVINLDRDTARLAKIARSCAEASIAYERFPAVDGRLRPPVLDHSRNTTMSPGTSGCYLSHRALWTRVASSTEPALIMEDDIGLRTDALARIRAAMAELLGWDVLMLECSEQAYWPPGDCVFAAGERVADGVVRMGRNRSLMPRYASNPGVSCIPGARAYLITPAGAAKLLRAPSAPPDVVLAAAFVTALAGYAFSPPLAFLPLDHDGVSNTSGPFGTGSLR